MRTQLLIGVAFVFTLGCSGSHKSAVVSGKVTLNGQPLANATVGFQPMPKKEEVDVGAGSVGKTNEKGEYTLMLPNGKLGAVVGKHKVIITSLDPKVGDDDARPTRGGPELVNKVPSRYSDGGKDQLYYEVPAGGTDKADFPLTSP